MSLTYSLRQQNQSQNQSWSRTTAVAFILILHAVAIMTFNNGLGSFFIFNPPPDVKYFNVKPEPKPYEFAPPPDTPPVIQLPALQPTPPNVGDITPDESTTTKQIGPPPDARIDGEVKPNVASDPPVSRLAVAHRVDPAYPASAERAGEEGTVLLEIEVDTLGHTMSVHVARSSGVDALDRAAIYAVKQWKFNRPLTITKVRIPITFKLSQRF